MNKAMKWVIGGVVVVLVAGCTTLKSGPNNTALITSLIMEQLSATLDSVDAALTQLKPGSNDKTVQDVKLVLAIAKPQIIGWVNTISQIQAANANYAQAVALQSKAAAVLPQIDVVLAK